MKIRLMNACLSYSTCGLWLHNLSEINWGTVLATALLIARLCKDVPEGYWAIKKLFNKRNNNDKSD